ncbi:two-partner secretion domain-containing protein [Oxynema aestuarii]|uniref:Filamentous hemagglutinin N-terminal domain-containing protein n=1 Tax=Oxynema aestuarii AP17 TaxID=2064643 RepID=A0A6H1TXJ3_9CYAN|nr:filamentous hemagglutinin N-terminal domain-containing protein [Oxynema aestuarii]QIZ71328.1 filamentous hemagglutinin N-terminal domain-containing protein [Oxynema aestuarii AP17]
MKIWLAWPAIALAFLSPALAKAQLIPDNSLGGETSTVAPQPGGDRIEGGAVRDTVLFHSFREFNVGEGQAVYFANPPQIREILTRVTGSNISQILGTLGVEGSANLYLINPNGIFFGNNARLDLGGAFVATTAEAAIFENYVFNTRTPEAPPLLSINVPLGVQYGGNPGSIGAEGAILEVAPGRDLSLLGGTVQLDGATLNAPGGRLTLGGLAAPGTIALAPVPEFPETGRADVSLTGNSRLNVVSGGRIEVSSQNLEIVNSRILAGFEPGSEISGAIAPDIYINATENLNLSQNSTIANELAAETIARGGNIQIAARSLSLTGGSRVQTIARSPGRGGDIAIDARDRIVISGFTPDGLFSGILTRSIGETGGPGGAIAIAVPSGDLTLSDRGFVAALTDSPNDGGAIAIAVNRLLLENGGQIVSATTASGNAGNIAIEATESVRVAGTSRDFVPNPFLNLTLFDLDNLPFTTAANPDVAASGTGGIPYISLERTPEQIISGTAVLGTAENAFDYYSFSIQQSNSRGIFDIDNGFTFDESDSGAVDTQIFLFNLTTGELIDANDDSDPESGGLGSDTPRDSYLETTLDEPGIYVIGVGEFESFAADGEPIEGNAIDRGDTYRLQVSLENQGTQGVSLPEDPLNPNNFNANINANSGIVSQTTGRGNAGSVTVHTGRLIVENRGQISTDTTIAGRGGDIAIEARDGIEIRSAIVSSITRGAGDAGNVTVDTQDLHLSEGGELNVNTLGSGNAGNIAIATRESVELSGEDGRGNPSSLRSEVEASATGNGGNVAIATRHLEVRDGAAVSTVTFGAGNAGTLRVNATDSVSVVGTNANGFVPSRILVDVWDDATGDGGNLTVTTRRLDVGDRAFIAASTRGLGNGGQLTIRASESVEVGGTSPDGWPATLFTDSLGDGDGGNFLLETGQLRVFEGGQISAGSFGAGDGGSLTVRASESVQLRGALTAVEDIPIFRDETGTLFPSGLFTASEGTGNAGALQVETPKLTVFDRAEITVSSRGEGRAGTLTVVTSQLDLDTQAKLRADNSGGLGNIDIMAADVRVRGNSRISTNARGSEPGGNIAIATQNLAAIDNSDISANAVNSQGGQVRVTAQGIFGIQFRPQLSDRSDITASSDLGAEFSGVVEVNTPEIDPARGLVPLPNQVTDPSDRIISGCPADEGNRFSLTGRGGLPADPRQPLRGETIVPDLRISATDPVEATGWIVGDRGQVKLIRCREVIPAEMGIDQPSRRLTQPTVHLNSKF